MERPAAGRRPDVLAAFACAAALVALTAWLGRLDLLDPDEGRHAEIAREMLAAGRWLTPVLHGAPYYDKPAAFYWLLGGSMSLLGENAFAARLPVAMAALWTVFVTALFARRAYGPRAGAFAAVGLVTTTGFVALGRTVVVDMCFTAALTSAFAWLGLWRMDSTDRRRPIWPFYVWLGIACLLKGPAAIVMGCMLAAALMIATREIAMLRALRPVRGVLLVLAVALPWYAAAWHADPSYIGEFLLRNNVERYLRPIGSGHHEPWYYYLVALPVGLLPWTPLLVPALASRLGRERRNEADVYCAVWAGVVLALFLPAATKLLTYLLPAFPPLIVLGAAWLAKDDDAARARHWIAPYAGAWALLVALASLSSVAGAWYVGLHASHGWLTFVSLLPLVAAVRARQQPAILPSVAAIAGVSLALTLVAYGFFAGVVNEMKGSHVAAEIVRHVTSTPGVDLIAYRCTPNTVAFYAGRPAVLTRERERARAAVLAGTGVVLTERKRLAELGFDPPPSGVAIAWQNRSGLVLVIPDHERRRGGEGRESNPPPTLEAGVTVLKTGRATGPDPSPF